MDYKGFVLETFIYLYLTYNNLDKEYDKKAMEAIRAASPLPKPPTAILSKMAKGQVILGFPL